ncbi:hypothetical protein H2204_000351 [Knufia peltigerae]|uniref:Cyclase n=1 Tax=Knufia peltigerae TaxID=1002370 RepID=A0AA38YES9_9EURO|nr:hypothetical protein H2204_000351 [Knufia peltigerae]
MIPQIIRKAFKESRDGVSISLNWTLDAIKTPGFGRRPLVHKVFSFKEGPYALFGFDDELEFNTQASSQWDSLVHFSHQATGFAYNGVKATKEALAQGSGNVDLDKAFPCLNHWHERRGLAGRGVLPDYRAYTQAKGIKYDCFDSHAITVEDLGAVGFTEELEVDVDEQEKRLGTHKAVGVKGDKKTAKWFWNHHFAAVAGDAIAFEVLLPTPEDDEDSIGTVKDLVLHQYFLSLFGLPIGELWSLKALAEHCKKTGRYEFLLTSIPLNVSGAVGSPPNALTIF